MNSILLSLFFIFLNFLIFKFYYNKNQVVMKTILIVLFFLGILFSVKFLYDDFFLNIILLDKKVLIILILISFALIFLPFLKNMDMQNRDLFKEKVNIDIGKFLSFEIILIFIVATIFQIFIIWDSAFLLKIISSK
jgi:hypothetical protein